MEAPAPNLTWKCVNGTLYYDVYDSICDEPSVPNEGSSAKELAIFHIEETKNVLKVWKFILKNPHLDASIVDKIENKISFHEQKLYKAQDDLMKMICKKM